MSRSIWARLKGLSITLAAGVVFSVISIVAIPFGDLASTDSFEDIVLELALGIVVTVLFWSLVIPGIWISKKVFDPGWKRQGFLLAILILGGVARGFAVVAFSEPFMFSSDAGLLQRSANSVSTSIFWLSIVSMFTDAAADFRRRYEAVFGQLALTRASRVSGSEVAKILGGLQSGLREFSEITIDETRAQKEMARIAKTLEREILRRVKAQSENLWRLSNSEIPKLRVLPLLRLAISRLDYSLGFVLVFFGLVSLLNIASQVGFEQALWRVALGVGTIALLDQAFRRLIRPKLKRPTIANGIFIFAISVMTQIPLGVAGYFVENSPFPWLLFLLSAASTGSLLVMLSTLNLADLARQNLLEEILSVETGMEAQEGALSQSAASSDLASFLHNSLQSEIQSIILALRNGPSDPSGIEIGQSSLQRLRLLSSRSLDEQFTSFSSLPRKHLNEVIDGWRGILDISLIWNLEPSFDNHPKLPTVVQIIEEVASNSAVHGRATAMSAEVSVAGENFLIRIQNNATNSPGPGAGQGSRWLENFAFVPDGANRVPGVFGGIFLVPANTATE